MTPQPHLISFSVCPFVQRARVVMNRKGITARMTTIDLDAKPDWFLERVPTGKVPALFVGDKTLFESSAINEFLDEISPGSALGQTPLERAEARAWIALTDGAILAQYRVLSARREDDLAAAVTELSQSLAPFETLAADRAAAVDISLLDAAIAPVFTRNAVVSRLWALIEPRLTPQVKLWAARLMAHPAVAASVDETFLSDLHRFFGPRGSLVLRDQSPDPATREQAMLAANP